MTVRALQDDLTRAALLSPFLRGEVKNYAPILRSASATVTIGMLRLSADFSA